MFKFFFLGGRHKMTANGRGLGGSAV